MFVVNPAYKKQTTYADKRYRFKKELELKRLSLEHDIIEKDSKNTEKQISLENRKKKLGEANPKLAFDADFDDYASSRNGLPSLDALKHTIYIENGYLGDENPDYRMMWDINGLVTRSKKNANFVEITEKGKEFLKRFEAISENRTVV